MNRVLSLTAAAVVALTAGIASAEEGKKEQHEGERYVCKIARDFLKDLRQQGVQLNGDLQKDAHKLSEACERREHEEGGQKGGDEDGNR